ncbi:MAG: hypothetical protein ACOC0E_11650, partial [Spirochaetota bacterium]
GEELYDEIEAQNERLEEIEEESGSNAREEYFLETVVPHRRKSRAAFVELRFLVLSALSLDQYVVSRLAAEMEARYFLDPDASVVAEFRSELESLRRDYEAVVIPYLVPSDI